MYPAVKNHKENFCEEFLKRINVPYDNNALEKLKRLIQERYETRDFTIKSPNVCSKELFCKFQVINIIISISMLYIFIIIKNT